MSNVCKSSGNPFPCNAANGSANKFYSKIRLSFVKLLFVYCSFLPPNKQPLLVTSFPSFRKIHRMLHSSLLYYLWVCVIALPHLDHNLLCFRYYITLFLCHSSQFSKNFLHVKMAVLTRPTFAVFVFFFFLTQKSI